MSREIRSMLDFVHYPASLYKPLGRYIFSWIPYDDSPTAHWISSALLLVTVIITAYAKPAYAFFGEFKGLPDITLYICYWTFLVNVFGKVLALCLGRGSLDKAFEELQRYYAHAKSQQGDFKIEAYFRDYTKWKNMLTSLNYASMTLFNALPVVQSLLEYFTAASDEGQVFKYRMPYMGVYPIDINRPLIYVLCYAQQCYAAYLLSCFNLGSDLLLVGTVQLLNMQFEYLAKRIREFKPTGTNEDLKELNGLIAYHRDIMICSQRVDQTFSPSILLNFIASGSIMCVTAFQIVAESETESLLKFFVFLISETLHVYSICLCCDKMITLSTDISGAFFQQEWYKANIKYQKMVVLPIARAQKPAQLTAFKFFVASMESFKTLATTSYQFFTLLSSTLNE